MTETSHSANARWLDAKILAFLAAIVLLLPVVAAARTGAVQILDFAYFYSSGMMLREGRGARLYVPAEQRRAYEEVAGRATAILNPYPPFQAVVFLPLAELSLRSAYVVFGVFNVFLWVFFLWLMRDRPAPRERPALCVLLAASFFPLWTALFRGQFSIILLVAFTLAFLCLEKGRDYLAGVLLGLGLLKFVIIAPFAFIFLLRGRWRFLGGLASAAAAFCAVSLIAVGPAAVASYLGLLVDIFRHPASPAHWSFQTEMPTIRGLLTLLLGGAAPAIWITALWALISGVFITAAAWRWSEARQDISFAVALVVSVLVAPHLYDHDLTPILLPIALVLGSLKRGAERCIILGAIAVLFLFGAVGLSAMALLAIALIAFATAMSSMCTARRMA